MSAHFMLDPQTIGALQELTAPKAAAAAPAVRLDGADEPLAGTSAQSFALAQVRLAAAASVQEWAEGTTEDGEGDADRLLMLLVGVADDNQDGELDADERAVLETAASDAWDYLESLGVSSADLELLFNSDDPEAANAAGSRVLEFIKDALPNGEEAAAEHLDDFAFDQGATQAVFDAVYKKRMAVRDGKKRVVMQRVSGHVQLSAAQKIAIRKAQAKSGSSMAIARRLKSMRTRTKLGLNR